jgi:hypothetical protein
VSRAVIAGRPGSFRWSDAAVASRPGFSREGRVIPSCRAVSGFGSGSVLEDVLYIIEGICRQDVCEPQLRGAGVLAGMNGVARHEDGRADSYRPDPAPTRTDPSPASTR